jgi:ADP-ribose pyrophosphatase YjhB (NUDIX family)
MTDCIFYKNLPKKRMGTGALFFNEDGEMLILKPTYKDGWTIPGGVIEADESPREACEREIKEEIGLDVKIKGFLCVDYKRGKRTSESLQFIFHGGILTPEQVGNIKLSPGEISEYKFLKTDEAVSLLSKGLQSRIPNCLEALKNNAPVYLEDGQDILL